MHTLCPVPEPTAPLAAERVLVRARYDLGLLGSNFFTTRRFLCYVLLLECLKTHRVVFGCKLGLQPCQRMDVSSSKTAVVGKKAAR